MSRRGGPKKAAEIKKPIPKKSATHVKNGKRQALEPTAPDPQSINAPGSDLREYGDWHEYEHRLGRPLMMKLPEFERNERLRHVIFSRQFTRQTLDRICQIAAK